MKLNKPFKYLNFSLFTYKALLFCCLCFVFTDVFAQTKPFVVVLDAGHGGSDPGKNIKKTGYKEKVVALGIVLKTGKYLEKIPGIKVIYTRKTDVFVDLWKRGNIANEADADLFVSVHCNAHTSQAKGAETWVLGLHANERNLKVAKAENEVILQEENHKERYQGFDPKSPTSMIGLSLEQEDYLDQSLLLASLIQEKFENKLRRVNRGVKQAGFVVLYQTYMPSVLIETGFLTNKVEGKYLYSKAGQEQMSKAITNSILEYYKVQKVNVADSDFFEPTETVVSEEIESAVVIEETIESQKGYYKIQLASGKNKVRTYSRNFKGLKNVERVKVEGGYKYYLSKYNTQSEANSALKLAKKKGYSSAYIVPFNTDGTIRNGKIISPKKSINSVSVLVAGEFKGDKIEPDLLQNYYYKVQLAYGKNRISTSSYNFKGIKNVERVKVEGGYKYYMSKYNGIETVNKALVKAKSKGYASAFVVAFNQDGSIADVKEKVDVTESKKNKGGTILYKVQLASSTKKINTEPKNFHGLSRVKAVKVGRYYKYYYGQTTDFETAKSYLQTAKNKKYKSAFLVAILNNKRITLKEALKLQTN